MLVDYGSVISREKVAKWCRSFKDGQTNVHDEERSGRSLIVTYEFVQKVEKLIRDDRHLMVNELHEMCLEVSRTVLYETIIDRLKFQKLSACWVPKIPTDEH